MRRSMFLFVFISLILFSAPYKPYPIIFVHGIGSNSMTWGVKCDKIPERKVWKNNEFYTDSMIQILTSPTESPTYRNMIEIMKPYAIAWDSLDPSYTSPINPQDTATYPNKAFLEIINYPNRMTVDSEDIPILRPVWSVEIREPVIQNTGTEWITCEVPIKYDTLGWEHNKGASSLLWDRVKEVLEEYYGEDWVDNPDAKVIIVAHSMGVFSIRYHPKMEYKSLAVGCQLIVHQITRG